MTHELIPASPVRDASDKALIQRILLVTARDFGIEVSSHQNRSRTGVQAWGRDFRAHSVSPPFENM